MSAAHANQAVALSSEAGWNQTALDWRLMIELGEAQGLWDEAQERLVASAIILPFGQRFGWISMVLVTARWRRRGLATGLLRDAIDSLLARGMTPGLDATEAGQKIYRPLGFSAVYPISRLAADAAALSLTAPSTPATLAIRPIEATDPPSLAAWDAALFGANRQPILTALYARMPRCGHVAITQSGAIAGYVMGRDGRVATQLGPIVANDDETAKALLWTSLGTATGRLFIDAVEHHPNWLGFLQDLGFTRQRGFVRMLLGRQRPLDDPSKVFAIAGPELG